ncbi:hypothetical protein Lal_00042664 [Lupinus albus]|nr:hypothetical protein Lal_00042664 [Lupinus albus]
MKPKLSDEESVSMFIDTLQLPFFDQMIGNVHSNFRQLIRIGERIENRFGSRKIKKTFANKVIHSDIAREDMKEETSFTEILNQPQTPYFPHASCYTFTNGREGRSRQRKRKSLYDPIPMSYAELLSQLFQRSLLTPIPSKKVEPPYPQGFNPYASCEYHTGEIGHFIEDCDQFKSKVQYLINSRLIRFQGNVLDPEPDVNLEPLRAHKFIYYLEPLSARKFIYCLEPSKQGESSSKSNPLNLTRLLANDAQMKVFEENFHGRTIFTPKYGETKVALNLCESKVDVKVFHKMGFIIDSVTRRTYKHRTDRTDEPEPTTEPNQPKSHAPSFSSIAMPTNQMIMDELVSLQGYITTRMDAFDTQSQQIHYELHRLSSRLSNMDVDEDSSEPES